MIADMPRILTPIFALTLVASATLAFAQDIDTVYRKNDPKPVIGEITAVAKSGVTVSQKAPTREVEVPANDISYIAWRSEPPSLKAARSNERSGKLEEAVSGFQEAMSDIGTGSAHMKTDVDFYLARAGAKLAQKDVSQVPSALEGLKNFSSQNRNSYHYYDVQILLAETALHADDFSQAEAAYSELEASPWLDYQMAAKIGMANIKLAKKDVLEARKIFDEVAASNTSNAAEQARKLEAMLGQASCLQQQTGYDEASTILNKIIDETDANQSRVLAEAYMKLGDGYAAQGQNLKAAILAYLHVDVIPSLAANADLHAEALYKLAKLWPAVNEPNRGADAAAKLEAEYPTSPWLKQLSGG